MAKLPTDEKFSHKEVKYERTSEHPGQACGNCKYVVEAMKGTRCQHVASPIYLNGWCIKFEKGK